MEIKKMNLMVAFLACLASCADDDVSNDTVLPDDGKTTTVKFEMNAKTGNYSSPLSRSVNSQIITPENFRILAFKKAPNSEEYFYAQDVPTKEMTYENELLSGTVRLPIGEYKFVSTYGLAADGGFALPTLTPVTTKLSDNLSITHETVDGSSVVFLEQGPLENLHPYVLGTTSESNEAVSATLNRAVARVDILFLQARKNADGTYTEVSDSADVFGVTKLDNIEMQFTGLNKNVNLVGKKITNDATSLFNNNFQITDLENKVTLGISDNDTEVGTESFLDYDNIIPQNIKKGSAHVQGAYVLPSNTTTGLKLVLTNSIKDTRIIDIPEKLPLEKNKVTIVKIYVLSGTVFNTDVQFNVTIDTAWFTPNTVEGEIN